MFIDSIEPTEQKKWNMKINMREKNRITKTNCKKYDRTKSIQRANEGKKDASQQYCLIIGSATARKRST